MVLNIPKSFSGLKVLQLLRLSLGTSFLQNNVDLDVVSDLCQSFLLPLMYFFRVCFSSPKMWNMGRIQFWPIMSVRRHL